MPMPEEKFVIRCRVSHGVTGTREGTLKDPAKNGKFLYFETMEAAEKRAKELMEDTKNLKAKFEYWPERTKVR